MSESMMVDIRKLRLFNKMAKSGANTVADHMSQLTGMETEMEITKINFMDIPDIETYVGQNKQAGVYIELVQPPHGYVLILFGQDSAKQLAQVMLGGAGGDSADGGFTEMEKSAVQEIGNIMTSGFIDGWANVLNTTIDISTPTFVYQPGSGIVEEVAGANDGEMALVFDSAIHAPASDIEAKVYTFPQLQELVALMNRIKLK